MNIGFTQKTGILNVGTGMTVRRCSEPHPLRVGEECRDANKPTYDNDKHCAFGRLNSPPRHPHRKGGDAFVVDRAVMPAPTAGAVLC